MVDGSLSSWQPLKSEVLQGSALGPTLFNIFIHDLDNSIESSLAKFAEDTKVDDEVDTSESRAILQRHLKRLEECTGKNCPKLNKNKWKVLHLGQHNHRAQYRLDLCGWGTMLLKGIWRSWWTTS